MPRQRPAEPPHEQGAHNNKPDTCGSSQNSCLLLHNDAWIKVTFLWAAFCHAAAILVRNSASPYLGSCPTEGQHEGQQMKRLLLMAWGSCLEPQETQILPSASPYHSNILFSAWPLPLSSLRLHLVGELLTTQALWGTHQGAWDEISLPTFFLWKSFSARDLECRTYTG